VRSARRAIGALATTFVLVTACGEASDEAAQGSPSPTSVSSTPSPSPPPECEAHPSTAIDLVAKNVHFVPKCLSMPDSEEVTVALTNRDHVNHNFSIYTPDDFSHVFTGDLTYPDETFRYRIPPLDAGVYLFQCDIHPRDMSGPLIVA
jgi:plastocyanin